MSEPWTPGPWKLEPEAAVGRWWRVQVGENRSFLTNKEADARLISLAPEMANILIALEREYVEQGEENAEQAWRWFGLQARELLARARGGDAPPLWETRV